MIMNFNNDMAFTSTLSFDPISEEDLRRIMNNGTTPTFTLYTTKEIQCRKHHKKRTNKKWAKRYGFKTVAEKLCDVKDIKVYGENDDGLMTYTMTGEL